MRTFQPKLVAVLAVLAAALVAVPLTGAAGPAIAAPSSSPSPTAGSSAPPTGTSSDGTAPGSQTAQKLTFGIGPAYKVPSTQVVDGRPYISVLATPGGTVSDAVAIF